MNKNKKVLLKNTVMLYILRFSTYFFSFITVPYQTRVLGVSIYGKIGIATALMMYFQLFLDFGFLLSATEEVARNRDNKKIVCEVMTSVNLIKICFSVISVIVLYGICSFVPQYRADKLLFFLYLMQAIAVSFQPDYIYRGLENMTMVTYRTVFTKALFTGMIFIFLKKPEDYYCVPAIMLLGELIATGWSFFDLKKHYGITFVKVNVQDVMARLKHSSTFFLSRIISTVYTATNTVILGFLDPAGITVGYYTAAYKLISTGQNALSPISDSIYPYMINNKDFKLVKKVLSLTMPIIFIGGVVIFIFADKICYLIFCADFAPAGEVLRGMMPLAVLTLPDYILGFPTLGAMGLANHANISIYVSSAVHVINLIVLSYLGKLNAVSLAWLMSVATAIEVLYRLIVVLKNKDKMKGC